MTTTYRDFCGIILVFLWAMIPTLASAQNLPAPTLSTPSNGSTGQSTTPSFGWSSVSGASSYRILVATNAADLPTDPNASTGGASVVINQTPTTTSYASSTLNAGTTYYWEVHARSSTLAGNWSSIYQFTTAASNPPAPALSTPNNGSTGQSTSPSFNWSSVSGASSYRIMVATNAADLPTDPNASTGGASVVVNQTPTTTNYASSTLNAGTTYYWEVHARNSTQVGNWSSIYQFTTAAANLPAPTLSNPSNGSTGQSTTPSFSWSSVTGATSYRVMVATNASDLPTDPNASTGGSSVVINDTPTGTSDTSSQTLNAGTTYYWEVHARNSSQVGNWSSIYQFTTAAAVTYLPAPTLSSPANGSTGQSTTPTFTWSSVSGASSYRILVATNSADLPTDPAASTGGASVVVNDTPTSTSDSPSQILAAGTTYYWEVHARSSTQDGTWSAIYQFTTAAVVTYLPAPTLSSPANGSTGQSTTPTFTWSSVSGASSYRILVATNSADLPTDPTASTGGPSVVVNDTPTLASDTPSQILAAGTTYYWEVHARSSTQDGSWSSIYQFTTASAGGGTSSLLGIDVSDNQASVSWPDVAAAGRSFAFVKASQGDSYADTLFLPNRMPLAAANLNNNVSAYHFADPDEYNDHTLNPALPFTDPTNPASVSADAVAEADEFFNIAGAYLKAPYLQPALDLENDFVVVNGQYILGHGGFNTSPSSLSGAPTWTWSEIAEWVNAWTSELQAKELQVGVSGIKPILYMTRNYAAGLAPYLASNNNYELWVAADTVSPSPVTPQNYPATAPPYSWSPSIWPWAVEQYNTTGASPPPGDWDSLNPAFPGLAALKIGQSSSPDNLAPSLSITSPINEAIVTSASLPVSGTASDSGLGNDGVSSVAVNGTNASGGTASGAGTANWSATVGLVAGANAITVIAKDSFGNSTTQTITVIYAPPDTSAPSLTIASPLNGATVTNASLTVSGTASDSGLGNNGVASVTINGTAATGGTASGSGTANWSATVNLAAGANAITVIAKDSFGNATTQTITVTYAPPDTSAPSLSITSPVNGATVTSASLPVSGTASDSGLGNNGVSSVTVNGTAATGGTASGSSTANWSTTVSLVAGANTITVVAKDSFSNATTHQITVTYNPPDTAPPLVSITSPANGAAVTNASVTVSGTASDGGLGNNGVSSVTVNGTAATGGTASGSGTANWSATVNLVAGANTITIVAKDGFGNATTQTISVTYNAPDTTPPLLSITSPANGATVTNASLTVSGTASDSGLGNNGVSSVTVNGTAAAGSTASGSGTANWTTTVNLAAGANTIAVVAKDGFGNAATQTISVTYTAVSPTTWVSRASGTSNILYGVANGSGIIVVVGASGTILTSTDCITWTSQTAGTSQDLHAITYGNGLFVVGGSNGTVLTSPDATHWTSRTAAYSGNIYGLTYGNSLFVAVGLGAVIQTSPDGINWTNRGVYGNGSNLYGAVWSNGIFVVSGYSSGISGIIVTSPTGNQWTTTSVAATNLDGVAYGTGLFIGVGDSGAIETSPDGINWTVQDSGTTTQLLGLAYGTGFIAVGVNGTILSSTDGVTWRGSVSGTSNNLNGAAYVNGTFLAVGNSGTILQLQSALMPFSQWQTVKFGANATNALIAGATATPQNDGVPNLLKYLYDIDPTKPMSASDRTALPALGIDDTTTPGTEYLTLTYRENQLMTGITVNVQTSSDLQTWTTLKTSDIPPDFLSQQIGTDTNTDDPIMEVGVKMNGSNKQFIRLNLTQP